MLTIAGGIILAVLFFWLLPLIIAGGIVLLGVGLAVLVLVLLFTYFEQTLAALCVLAAIAVSFGIPYKAFLWASERYPNYRAVVDGDAPYKGLRMLPLRVAIIGASAVGGVGFAFALLNVLVRFGETYWPK